MKKLANCKQPLKLEVSFLNVRNVVQSQIHILQYTHKTQTQLSELTTLLITQNTYTVTHTQRQFANGGHKSHILTLNKRSICYASPRLICYASACLLLCVYWSTIYCHTPDLVLDLLLSVRPFVVARPWPPICCQVPQICCRPKLNMHFVASSL